MGHNDVLECVALEWFFGEKAPCNVPCKVQSLIEQRQLNLDPMALHGTLQCAPP